MRTGTCFIQKIHAPSSSLHQGKHLPFSSSPLRVNMFRLFVTQVYRYTPEIFLFSTVIISKLRSGMYIFLLFSLTSTQWSKITELGYRFATIQRHLRLHLLYYYKYNTQKTFLSP